MDERLQAVSQCMPHRFQRLIDVGSDHAILPIELVSNARCNCAIATELNLGPFNNATANVVRAGLAKQIEVKHGDGICGMALEATDVVTMCGLGGREAARIMSEQIAGVACTVIVQPEKSIGIFRQNAAQAGFAIVTEKLVCATNFIYQIIVLRYDGVVRTIERADRFLPTSQTDLRDEFDRMTWLTYLRRLAKHATNLRRSEPDTARELARRIVFFQKEIESEYSD